METHSVSTLTNACGHSGVVLAQAGSLLPPHAVGSLLLRPCELCAIEPARVYCAPDEAQLCWDCDARIHGANFLVARHPRAPMCPSCGAILSGSPGAASLCQACFGGAVWALDSDEESKVIDSSDYEEEEEEEELEDAAESRLEGHRHYGSRGWRGDPVRWATPSAQIVAAVHNGGRVRLSERWNLSTEEGMGDSQD